MGWSLWKELKLKNWQRADTQKMEGKGGEEDRNCEGRLH